MKGIILAGGFGTRLYPLTTIVSKQLLPIYDKPMIYYPLSTLMLSGIQEILIISDPINLPRMKELFGDGSHLGLKIEYKVQPKPEGLAQAFILGKEFIDNDSVCLVLGDNIFYADGFGNMLRKNAKLSKGGLIFGYWVSDPERYGVVEFDKNNTVLSIEEKPKKPKSNYAIPGLYYFDNNVSDIASGIKPSARGEYEITAIHNHYLQKGELSVELFGRGLAWLDTGTHESLLDASNFVQTIEKRQGLKIACIEEIALRMNFISEKQFELLIDKLPKNTYRKYLEFILKTYEGE